MSYDELTERDFMMTDENLHAYITQINVLWFGAPLEPDDAAAE